MKNNPINKSNVNIFDYVPSNCEVTGFDTQTEKQQEGNSKLVCKDLKYQNENSFAYMKSDQVTM